MEIDIGGYTGEIVAEELSATAVSALHAVSDVNRPVLIAEPADAAQEIIRGHVDTSHPLDAFDDHRGDLIPLIPEAVFQRLLIVEGEEDDVFRTVHRRNDIGIVGGGHCE